MNRLTQKKQKARNFARAFLRAYEIAEAELFAGINVLRDCYREYPLVFHLLELSSARVEEKYQAIDELSEKLGLPAQLASLLHAVMRYKEFHLLGSILEMLQEEYKRMHSIQDVVVSTSHPLDMHSRECIEKLVAAKIIGTLRFTYAQDPALIAGIRIETPLYCWEHSAARTIQALRQQREIRE